MEEDLIGRDVLLPGSAWKPALDKPQPGFITKKTEPSVRYPYGRFEVACIGHKDKYMFRVEAFNRDWVLETSNNSSQAGAKSSKTPTKRGRSSAPADGPPSATKTPRGRSKGRKSAPAVTSPTAITATPSPRSKSKQSGNESDVTTPRAGSRSTSRSRSPRRTRTPKSGARDAQRTPSGRRVTFKTQPHVTTVPRKSWSDNLLNALVMIAVGLPAAVLGWYICSPEPASLIDLSMKAKWPVSFDELLDWHWWSRLDLHQPFLFVNLVFFLNVDVLFWVVSMIQKNTWLIDPYWTIIPVMIQLYYQNRRLAEFDPRRSTIVAYLIYIWSARLTFSYFRREDFQFGAREDWRFTALGQKTGRHWWWLSFFATYLSQHAMLVGITTPLLAVYTTKAAWSELDTIASLVCATGIVVAFFADNQLANFMTANRLRRQLGLAPVPILDTGLWRYSRHPNYFGENLFWFGLSLFAVRLGQPIMVLGAVFNAVCMVFVTMLTEERMASRPERKEVWEEYKRTTSAWVPWFKLEHEKEQ